MLHTHTYVGSSIIYTCTDGEKKTDINRYIGDCELREIEMYKREGLMREDETVSIVR